MDLLCFEDVDSYARETTDPVVELEQDLFHRLLEAPGENPDDEDRGVGLVDMLSGPIEPERLSARIAADFKKDPRVTNARATLTELEEGVFRVAIEIQANEKELGLVVDVNALDGTFWRAA